MATAMSADDTQIANQHPSKEAIARWRKLFGYSHMEAVWFIGDQREDRKSSPPLSPMHFMEIII